MDDERTELPSAAELGISEAAYQRILRDLHQRQLEGRQGPLLAEPLPAVAPPPEGVTVPRPEPMADPPHPLAPPGYVAPTASSRRKVMSWVVAGSVCVVLLVVRLGASGALSSPGPDGERYAFMEMNGDRPVAYSSCRPVQVAVYPAYGPSNGEALVREAVAQVRAATGLDIVVLGSFGGHAPNWNFEAGPVTPTDPISVSWQDASTIPNMTDNVAGRGGSYTRTTPNGTRVRYAGTITLARGWYAEMEEQGEHDYALAVLLHEFGHVLGLAHVSSPAELMNEDNIGRTSFGKGDLEGLRQLGQGPCV